MNEMVTTSAVVSAKPPNEEPSNPPVMKKLRIVKRKDLEDALRRNLSKKNVDR